MPEEVIVQLCCLECGLKLEVELLKLNSTEYCLDKSNVQWGYSELNRANKEPLKYAVCPACRKPLFTPEAQLVTVK